MSQKDFEPITGQLGISGTSYGIQFGVINGKWAIRLLRGKGVIDCNIFHNETDEELPNRERIIAWILNAIPMNVNSYQVQITVGFLIKQTQNNREKKKVLMSLRDAEEIELKGVPEVELKKSIIHGWVMENKFIKFCPYCGFRITNCPNCGKRFN
jgi:hypothetical protein